VVSGDRILTGDSIAYNRELGFGEAFGNMSLQDTRSISMWKANMAFYNEKTEYAFATDSARFLEFSQGDTLFLHGDTLKMTTVDSLYREVALPDTSI